MPECNKCTNLHCKIHFDQIASYTTEVLEAIEASTVECLPMKGGRSEGKNLLIGWKEFVKPFQEESKFWHSIWVSSGKPMIGQVFQLMKSSKHQFRYAIRRLQKAQNNLQRDKFMTKILKGVSSIFDEIKKFRGALKEM